MKFINYNMLSFSRFKKINTVKKVSSKPTISNIFIIISYIMIFIGLIFIFDASIYRATLDYHDKFAFVSQQIKWVVISSILMFIVSKINYKLFLGKNSTYILILTYIVLFLVLFFASDTATRLFGTNKIGILQIGSEAVIGGSKRWFIFDFGGSKFSLQPSEFAKISIILFLSSWLVREKSSIRSFKEALKSHFKNDMLGFLFVIGSVCLLTLLQPDMGTSIIILLTAFIMYFISGSDFIHTIGSAGLVLTLFILGIIAIIIAPYRFERFMIYKDVFLTGHVSEEKAYDEGHQIQQILIGIGTGHWQGKGIGNSRQQYGFLVENTAFTDSISAVYLEETGWIGSIVIILSYFLLVLIGKGIAEKVTDPSGKLIVYGVISWICVQALIHIAANSATIPLTGVPLPFFTYGGSSTMSIMIGIGIIRSVEKYG